MVEFKVLKKSTLSGARIGVLRTGHGEIETPAFVPVATRAVVRTLVSEEVADAGCQLLIANTFHLHLRPGERVIKRFGGVHTFMNWKRPLMTDSGGFQVFSLGFGRELKTSKIVRSVKKSGERVKAGAQPKLLKIREDGVEFASPIDGARLFLGPQESIRIQEALGADIIFAFDECPPPLAEHEYMKNAVDRTHLWAETCLKVKKSEQALFGIVQGGGYRDLRIQSARFIGLLPFHGFGIGGEFGASKEAMATMIRWVVGELPEEKPRHLLGIGHVEDIPKIIKAGVDTFDCTVPTHYARHGIGFTSQGRFDAMKAKYLKSKEPIDTLCDCVVCRGYTRGYITHLMRAGELSALHFLTLHNLWFFNEYVRRLREEIKKGVL